MRNPRRFEFERELDLSEFCEGAGVYVLHSVSVHQGDVNSGHYYCFIRPPPGDQWFAARPVVADQSGGLLLRLSDGGVQPSFRRASSVQGAVR